MTIIDESDVILSVKDLTAEVDGIPILKGLNLEIKRGEIHAIMGPNGSGKSTLASIIAGNEAYQITEGDIVFMGSSLLDLQPHQRAAAGVFLAFQYPVEIPGVSMMNFMKTAINEIRAQKGLEPMETHLQDFDPELHEALTEIPAPSEELKGKIIDTIEKGYKLGDKIIRYAKVVVGN